MTGDPLSREKAFLREHLDELARNHPGKYLLIHGEELHGAFETYEKGVEAGTRMFGAGPFLVRSVLEPDDAEAPSVPTLSIGVPLVANTQQ